MPVRKNSPRPPAGQQTSHQLSVVYRPIDELKPDPRNPRQHSRAQIRQIARSIESFGFNVPVLVDRDLKVIAGHGRLLACRDLGWSEVPTIQLEYLSEAQARAFVIADNRLTEISSWDDELLAERLKELAALDLDFDLEATGFAMGEIDLRIEDLDESAEVTDVDPADDLPSLSPVISGCWAGNACSAAMPATRQRTQG